MQDSKLPKNPGFIKPGSCNAEKILKKTVFIVILDII
jgi:hypothetical protein